jgi:hypothetical protein
MTHFHGKRAHIAPFRQKKFTSFAKLGSEGVAAAKPMRKQLEIMVDSKD